MSKHGPLFPSTITVRTVLEDDGTASMCLMRDGKVVALESFDDEDAAMMGVLSAILSLTCQLAVDVVERLPDNLRPFLATTLAALSTAAAFDACRLAIEQRLSAAERDQAPPDRA